ncbi:MAG: NAD(P)/FAD-dependent oxidoreductase [Woeseiaceae bacterium]
MNRRTLLQLLSAATLAGCGQQPLNAQRLRVVVAGAGIVGASIAYQLAKAGADVTVIDQNGPATQASRGTFAWVNATWAKQPRSYHALSQEGVANWQDWQAQLKLPVRWGGSLEWFSNAARQQRLVEQIEEQVAWGEPARMANASALRSLEPKLQISDSTTAAFSPNDGAVDPVIATQKLLAAASTLGATVRYPATLTGTVTTGTRLKAVETSVGRIPADRLVLATGAAPDTARRFAGIDIPQRSTPGVIAITKPMPRLIERIVVAPGVHLHQRDDGRVVMGEQAGAPDTAAHDLRLRGRPTDFPSALIAEQHGRRIRSIAEQFIPSLAAAEIESAVIGWRPLPVDGHPVLGVNPEQPDVYMAIMHSGVSLAPIVGQLAALEIAEGAMVERLMPYRPTRSFSDANRY